MLAFLADGTGRRTSRVGPTNEAHMYTVRQIHNRVIGALVAIAALGVIGIIAECAQLRVDEATQEEASAPR